MLIYKKGLKESFGYFLKNILIERKDFKNLVNKKGVKFSPYALYLKPYGLKSIS